jgi:biopolymer transport protein ExbD
MNLRPRKPDEPEVNITSLIDVVLMLLVFFMVSTSFVQTGGLKINLPRASAAAKANAHDRIEVAVDEQGRFFVNKQPLADTRAETLKRALAAAAGAKRGMPLFIRADAKATNQSVVTVMDVAGQLGFTRIRILTTHQRGDR